VEIITGSCRKNLQETRYVDVVWKIVKKICMSERRKKTETTSCCISWGCLISHQTMIDFSILSFITCSQRRACLFRITSKTATNQNGHKSYQNGHTENPKRPQTKTAKTKTATTKSIHSKFSKREVGRRSPVVSQ